jgi:hypothetical protein
MQKVLTIIIALLPSYFSLFCSGAAAASILFFSTMFGICATAFVSEKEPVLMDKVRFAWVLHLIAICIVVAFFNLKP